MSRAIVVIPARFASQRFPGKVLADRTGWPLIRHVYEQARRATCVDEVVVATDDDRIERAVHAFGGRAIRTAADHPNGTARIAEAIESFPAADDRLIVNVQGDEPEIEPALVDLAVAALAATPACPVATLASPFAAGEDPSDPNLVKVVCDRAGRALYFSRALIPFDRDGQGGGTPLKHVGLYVYRRPFLAEYARLEPTPLERVERLEQLRILEHGHPIRVAVGAAHRHGIDTEAQYDAFVARWQRSHGTAV